jgi:hypothetical protein
MIKRLTLIIVALFAAVSLQSCKTTQAQLASFWNSPTVQAQIAAIETGGNAALNAFVAKYTSNPLIHDELVALEAEGEAALNAYITSHLGAAKGKRMASTASAQLAISKQVAASKAAHPDVPDNALRAIISAKFKG